jgi:hypothetical protein
MVGVRRPGAAARLSLALLGAAALLLWLERANRGGRVTPLAALAGGRWRPHG